MSRPKIGFLPLYIKLYDDSGSGAKARPRLEPFAVRLSSELEKRGFEVFHEEEIIHDGKRMGSWSVKKEL